MNVRNATYRDAPAIKALLQQLGYTSRLSVLVDQLELLFNNENHEVFVYDLKKEILAFATVHYLPQLALDGMIMIISYFSVDEAVKDVNVAIELERYITNIAMQRKCDRIEVHCKEGQAPVHEFYFRQGYQQYPKYLIKRFFYGS